MGEAKWSLESARLQNSLICNLVYFTFTFSAFNSPYRDSYIIVAPNELLVRYCSETFHSFP